MSPEESAQSLVFDVRERHVADAERVVVAQQAQAVLDGVPALDAHQRGDLALLVNALDVVGRGGEHEIVGVARDDVVPHGVDHVERAIRGVIAFHVVGIHVDGEELRADAAFLERVTLVWPSFLAFPMS